MRMNLSRAVALIAVGVVCAGATLAFESSQSARRPEPDRDPPGSKGAPLGVLPRGAWAEDPIWHDGLVEKAVYDAQMVIYGRPRRYEAVFLTNKEQHDAATWTKDADGQGERVEVWKHNQVEVVPTPNYEYKFVTTSHLTTAELELTRLDASSQEWCGTSFKQYQRRAGDEGWDYFGFSYLPQQGRQTTSLKPSADAARPVVPYNSLPLWLRGYDFEKRQAVRFLMLGDQKGNATTSPEPVPAVVEFVEETPEAHVLRIKGDPTMVKKDGERVVVKTRVPGVIGTVQVAKDRNNVMLAYEGADGQKYRLKSLQRVNYWTRDE